MAVSKVIYAGETLVDLTTDTVTPSSLLEGVTAHNAGGVIITGTVGVASSTANGLMSSSDKTKLDGLFNADGHLVFPDGSEFWIEAAETDDSGDDNNWPGEPEAKPAPEIVTEDLTPETQVAIEEVVVENLVDDDATTVVV